MAFTVLASSGCDDGTCPTIYRDEATGDVLVQGYIPAQTEALPDFPAGETGVRIPAAVWTHLLAQTR